VLRANICADAFLSGLYIHRESCRYGCWFGDRSITQTYGVLCARPRANLRAPHNDTGALDDLIEHALGQRFSIDFGGCCDTKTLHLGNESAGQIGFEMHLIRTTRAAPDDRLQSHRWRRQARPDECTVKLDTHSQVRTGSAKRLNDPSAATFISWHLRK